MTSGFRMWRMAAGPLCLTAACAFGFQQPAPPVLAIQPPPTPFQRPSGTPFQPQLVEVRKFLHVDDAWKEFDVKGRMLTVAVIDTGLFTTHQDFAATGKIPAQLNLTADNGGNRDNATDGQGHGTNVGGIIAANGVNTGVAPEASIVPIKVLTNKLEGSFDQIRQALSWVLQHAATHRISVVSISLGHIGAPFTGDTGFKNDALAAVVRDLRAKGIPVVVAAGNFFKKHDSKPGMAYPAILRETISVGAVYDADGGTLPPYGDGSKAHSRSAGQITPFTHRLHESINADCRTDIFAPGAPVTSTGLGGPKAQSVEQGTSQAAPVTAGIVLLMQELYRKKFPGQLPAVNDLERWLREGGFDEVDGDNEADNVAHPQPHKTYRRLDALGALRKMAQEIGIAPAKPDPASVQRPRRH